MHGVGQQVVGPAAFPEIAHAFERGLDPCGLERFLEGDDSLSRKLFAPALEESREVRLQDARLPGFERRCELNLMRLVVHRADLR